MPAGWLLLPDIVCLCWRAQGPGQHEDAQLDLHLQHLGIFRLSGLVVHKIDYHGLQLPGLGLGPMGRHNFFAQLHQFIQRA
jgi:hypothetical protein